MVSNVWLGMKQICCLLFFFNWHIMVICFNKHAFVLHYTYVYHHFILRLKQKMGTQFTKTLHTSSAMLEANLCRKV